MTNEPRPVWRKTIQLNGPTSVHGAKADLLPLPDRFDAMVDGVLQLGASSWGVNEASTRTFDRVMEISSVRGNLLGGHRAKANDMWGPHNGIGNHNYWVRDDYRAHGRRNVHTDAGPNERGLNMALTSLVDEDSGAQHAELQVHNYAKPHAPAAARRQVEELILDVVSTCHARGLLLIVRGDLNADKLPGAIKAGLRHAGQRDVQHVYVSKQIETKPARALVKGWRGEITDHTGALLVPFRVPVTGRRVSLPAF